MPAHAIIAINLLSGRAVLFVNEDSEANGESREEGWRDGGVGFEGKGRRVAGACCRVAGGWDDVDCGCWHGRG